SEEYKAVAGVVIVCFPNQIHSYVDVEESRNYLLIFSEDLCPEFKSIFKNKLPLNPIINIEKETYIKELFESMISTAAGDDVYKSIILRADVLLILSNLFKKTEFKRTADGDSIAIKDVVNYCSENFARNLHLSDFESDLHLSKYYVSHLFKQKLGIGFNEYLNMLRVSAACDALSKQDSSITEIAYLVGYNCDRSFNRAFLKFTGKTPRDYRREKML
ncbi:MAG: AraC family transcriptional regulator, partial [Oscillospiraceae bacterium]